MKIFISAKLEKEARKENKKKRKAKDEGWRISKVLRLQEEEEEKRSQEPSVLKEGTEVSRGSLTQVLADLIHSQGLSTVEPARPSGALLPVLPKDLVITPCDQLSKCLVTQPPSPGLTEVAGPREQEEAVTEAEQVDAIDLSRAGREAEEQKVQTEIVELMQGNKDLWAKCFPSNI